MKKIYLVSVFLVLFANLNTSAQTSILNVPSTEVIAPKTFYSEVNYSTHFDKGETGFKSYGYKMVYGIAKNVEVGTNFYFTRGKSYSVKEVQVNAKWKVLENEKHGLSVVSGLQICLPLKNSIGLQSGAMFYANARKSFSTTKGTRVTGGYYRMVGTKNQLPSRNGLIAGIEQPITKKISFIADWYSGKNRFSYSSAGFKMSLGKKQMLYAGYNFGNFGRANNYLSIGYGVFY